MFGVKTLEMRIRSRINEKTETNDKHQLRPSKRAASPAGGVAKGKAHIPGEGGGLAWMRNYMELNPNRDPQQGRVAPWAPWVG